ncbi:hypothetical protein AN2379.2 [Aspergillus nidulans FGSC A4]|nr:hypothetical protein AN2379.2 [Aspergillus nidulans FGSC A4]|eukprot:XP_659983.1 hypothetical protein AN2379.2 [Aspergillus nidulans FGSC A4]
MYLHTGGPKRETWYLRCQSREYLVSFELLQSLAMEWEVTESLTAIVKLIYVDETAELTAMYRQDDEAIQPVSAGLGSQTPPRLRNADRGSTVDGVMPSPSAAAINNGRTPSAKPVLHGLVKPLSTMPRSPSGTLEFGLLGYFIDHLSMWLDLCDPERHFQLLVPHRARNCPPLMNAILAASARHLTRVPKYRAPAGAIQYKGRILHNLTEGTALQYHNQCIHGLLELSGTTEQTRNEDLLAAAIILRFYEEVDYPLQEDSRDNELFLRVLNMFIEAQIPDLLHDRQRKVSVATMSTCAGVAERSATADGLHDSSSGYGSPPDSDGQASIPPLESRWYMSSLRQAAFWVAFRQEVYSAFLKQRPFNMSLSRCDLFRSFAPGEDALWTARLVVFCADVLELCYGNTAHAPAQGCTRERWEELNALSQKWAECLPPSFEPIYCREADRQHGEVFPEICYLSNIHVAGVQHLELARILLAVYNPALPRLGLGYQRSMRDLSGELRAAVLRLCGIGVSNRQNPPSLTTALLGIVVCGEHIEDRNEQCALLGLLDELEYHHGWPVASYRNQLEVSWGVAVDRA